MPPETIMNLEVLVQPENVEKGLRAMLDRKGGRTSKTIYGMAYMLKTIAKHYVRLPAGDIGKLEGMCRRLRVPASRYDGKEPETPTSVRR